MPSTKFFTIDAETYYDRFYSLKKMTPAEYILDQRFELICVSVKEDDGPAEVIDGPDFPAWLKAHPPDQCISLTYNSLFDNCILAWRYQWVPSLMIDGLGMARHMLGHLLRRLSLEEVAEYLQVGHKGHEVQSMLGVNRAQLMQNPVLKQAFYRYCANDSDLCKAIFNKLAPGFPRSEFRVMDLTLRAAVCPVFQPNIPLLRQYHKGVVQAKEELLAKAGISKGEASSEAAFCRLLEQHGVEVEMKVTDKGNAKPALAKTDDFMKSLEEHPDPDVQALAAARIGTKSTLEEKRSERLINIATLPWMAAGGFAGPRLPIPLRYSGAHTHRLSGDWKINMQNLPSGRGGRSTALRQSLEAPPGYRIVVGDLSKIEALLTAWLSHSPLFDVFKAGKDTYKFMASQTFGVPEDQIDKTQRNIGKAEVLGLGFGLGKDNFYIKTVAAARMNNESVPAIFTPEFAGKCVEDFRRVNFPTVNLWRLLDEIIRTAWMGLAAGPAKVGPVEIGHGYVKGPGGLTMRYRVPYTAVFEDGICDGSGDDPIPNKWQDVYYEYGGRRSKFYGAALLENIIQFLARIILFDAAVRMYKLGYPFASSSHDELGYVVPERDAEKVKQLLLTELTRRPIWGADIPLGAEVSIGANYSEAK